MGPSVVTAPASDDRIDLFDKLLRCQRRFSSRSLSDLFLEVFDGFLSRIGIQSALTGLALDLFDGQL